MVYTYPAGRFMGDPEFFFDLEVFWALMDRIVKPKGIIAIESYNANMTSYLLGSNHMQYVPTHFTTYKPKGKTVRHLLIFSDTIPKAKPIKAYEKHPVVGAYHVGESSVDFIKVLIENYTKKGDIVLDPMAGSGSTAVACKDLGRDYIMIEKNEAYVRTIKERLGE